MPGTLIDSRDTKMNQLKSQKSPFLVGLHRYESKHLFIYCESGHIKGMYKVIQSIASLGEGVGFNVRKSHKHFK
jgi:hypothetical protein